MTASLTAGCSATAEKGEDEQSTHRARSASQALTLLGTRSDTLAEYAAKCDVATGIHVPGFNCDTGTEVPGQTMNGAGNCDEPNVLYGGCDPGSRFQVLPGRTADAVAVAHCRRRKHP